LEIEHRDSDLEESDHYLEERGSDRVENNLDLEEIGSDLATGVLESGTRDRSEGSNFASEELQQERSLKYRRRAGGMRVVPRKDW
jgi:hypothetical protein